MATRYQIWDKESDIFTPGADENGKSRFSASEWLERYPWAAAPGAKMIITAGVINGGAAMEFEATKRFYREQGAEITEGMTDGEVLDAIEAWEDGQKGDPTESTAEERIAAALELANVMNMPAVNDDDPDVE